MRGARDDGGPSRPPRGREAVPGLVARSGREAVLCFRQFIDSGLSNPHTRSAYGRAIERFLSWCSDSGHQRIDEIEPGVIAAYVRQHRGSQATIAQHLAAIRSLFDEFVGRGILHANPAASIRLPRATVPGVTPVLSPEETRAFLNGIDTRSVVGVRDRAMIGVMVLAFARVGSVVALSREDYTLEGERGWLVLRRWTGRTHAVPLHARLRCYLDEYLEAAQIEEGTSPLFRSVDRHRALSETPLTRTDVLRMVKRRARAEGLPLGISCRTLRASGISAYLENGGTPENARLIAGHQTLRAIHRYSPTPTGLSPDVIDRIGI